MTPEPKKKTHILRWRHSTTTLCGRPYRRLGFKQTYKAVTVRDLKNEDCCALCQRRKAKT